MPLSKWAKHLRFSNNLLLITHSSYLKKRILQCAFFVNTAIRRLITILHYTTLLEQYLHFSETFPSQCRSHLVRMSFASRSHYGV